MRHLKIFWLDKATISGLVKWSCSSLLYSVFSIVLMVSMVLLYDGQAPLQKFTLTDLRIHFDTGIRQEESFFMQDICESLTPRVQLF